MEGATETMIQIVINPTTWNKWSEKEQSLIQDMGFRNKISIKLDPDCPFETMYVLDPKYIHYENLDES